MPEANQRVGEYVLDEIVGQGAYAQVWRAHHHMWSDQLAAVKIPFDQGYLKNLQAETIRIHRLSHPNIVKPVGFDPMANPPYLMSEFVTGGSLRPLIDGKKITVSDTVNILRQVLMALQFGHEKGIIHGDIKPDNVLVEEGAAEAGFGQAGSVKVTDFGIGLAATATATGDAAAKAQAQNGGTLAYLAPEQRDGGAPPDVRSDVYAVGVMLFELLTGERPSGADLPSELNSQVPQALDDIFRRSYARRERRYESAQQFLDALNNGVMGGASAQAPAKAVAPPPPPPVYTAPAPAKIAAPPAAASVAPAEAEDLIAFRDEDDVPVAAPVKEVVAPVVIAAPVVAESKPQPATEPEPVEEEEAEPVLLEEDEMPPLDSLDDTRGGDESVAAAESGEEVAEDEPQAGLMPIPAVPRVASRADRQAIFDELTKKQIRTSDELIVAMRTFFDSRELDQGETNNVRLRLIKWANAIVGGDSDFDNQLVLSRATARPLYQVRLITRYDNREVESNRVLENPAEKDCISEFSADDYRLLAHLSTDKFTSRLFESMGHPPLRAALNDVIRQAILSNPDAIRRQDIFVGRANVVVVDYQFEGSRFKAFMVGNSLKIVAPNNPFEKIKEDPTKRAATLLDSEQLRLGIKELRRGLDSKWSEKASVMISALRGKLAAAYLAEAKDQFDNFGWLESLEMTGKAGQLAGGQDETLNHALLVRKRTNMIQLWPGYIIALVFMVIAVMGTIQSKPGAFKPFAIQLLSNTFFAAALATIITTLTSWKILGMRMSRTDFAWYQAMLLPAIVGGILALAPTRFANWQGDIVAGLLVAVAITIDVMVFKYFRSALIRRPGSGPLGGDEATVLLRIETMLDNDWEQLRPHYLKLYPLYSYASTRGQISGLDEFEEADKAEPGKAPAPRASSKPRQVGAAATLAPTGNAEVDRLAAQVTSRINAGARALIPPARMIITLLGEYTKAVSGKQLGMVQTNAQKIEQKGRDLALKMDEFEQLCRSPLTLDSSEAGAELRRFGEEMSRRPQEPDFMILRSMAESAKNFQLDQVDAVTQLNQILPDAQEALDRLKKI